METFLRHVPADSGIAFVIVQHLDPTHQGILVELLQRVTPIEVLQAREGMRVEPDRVYVIPPNKDMSILNGVLQLFVPLAPRGLRLPIDYFFRSLAEDRQERSIGVILSGMGSDGTLGLRAIKEKAGLSLVQAPETAQFDSMPRSAIDAGLADVVAPVGELPGRILAYLKHVGLLAAPDRAPGGKAQSSVDKVLTLLRARTGSDFSQYKATTVQRRLERRMGIHRIDTIDSYIRYLQESPQELDLLFKELLIGVTSFFRDPEAWQQLQGEVLPALLAARPAGHPFRAWMPACSTGEEAFSLAIVFKEALDQAGLSGRHSVQIFGTDLDRDAIDRARLGRYSDGITADVSPDRLHRFFVQEGNGYRVSGEIREIVLFAAHNAVLDPPFTRLDLLVCRNLLIYLVPKLQRRLLQLFHYSLNVGGYLFLGSAETTGGCAELFTPLSGRTRIYRRQETSQAGNLEFPARQPLLPEVVARPQSATADHPSLQAPADRVLLERFSPAAVLVDENGDILYINGRTGKYLEPAAGKANWNIFAMAREGLRADLGPAFRKALRERDEVCVRNLRVGTEEGTQAVDLTVRPLAEPEALRGTVLVVLADVPAPSFPKSRRSRRTSTSGASMADLERELQQAREELQTTREEMQTSQEELRSTNEEFQSTNEELQSTNEELTTSKEEMQSMNEELQTVNSELQARVDELSRANSDMKNLLDNTDIAVLFLDGEFKVRRFTTQASRLFKLIPGDVGRSISDIASDLDFPAMLEDAREVLRTLVFVEKQVPGRDGRWFISRIMPYRTLENMIDGVVITFADITASKSLESDLREREGLLRQMLEVPPGLTWTCRPEGTCDSVGSRWIEYTGLPEAEHLGFGWLAQVHPEDRERVDHEWRVALRSGTRFEGVCRLRRADERYLRFRIRATPLRDPRGAILKWHWNATDIETGEQGMAPADGADQEHET